MTSKTLTARWIKVDRKILACNSGCYVQVHSVRRNPAGYIEVRLRDDDGTLTEYGPDELGYSTSDVLALLS